VPRSVQSESYPCLEICSIGTEFARTPQVLFHL
jgi:hypothetical protein